MNKFLVLVLAIALQTAHGAQGASEWADSYASGVYQTACISSVDFAWAERQIRDIENNSTSSVYWKTGQVLELRKRLNIDVARDTGLTKSRFVAGKKALIIDQRGQYKISDVPGSQAAGAESAFAAATSEAAPRVVLPSSFASPTDLMNRLPGLLNGLTPGASAATERPVIHTTGMGGSILNAVLGMGADGSFPAAGASSAPATSGFLGNFLNRASSVQAVGSSGVRDVAVPDASLGFGGTVPAGLIPGAVRVNPKTGRNEIRCADGSIREISDAELVRQLDPFAAEGAQAGTARTQELLMRSDGEFDEFTAAVFAEDVSKVTQMIKDGWDINQPDGSGETSLYLAVKQSYPGRDAAMVRLLLAKGAEASVNIPSPRDGITPLQAVFANGMLDGLLDISVLELLLKNGADLNLPDGSGRTPLLYLLGMLNDNIPGTTAYTNKEIKRAYVARILLERGAGISINHESHGHHTALLQAVLLGNKDIVENLLSYGANPTLGEAFGLGTLGNAVARGPGELANLLFHAITTNPVWSAVPLPFKADTLQIPSRVSTLMGTLARGGEHCVENIERLLGTSDGLKALSVKVTPSLQASASTAAQEYPEKILERRSAVADPALRDQYTELSARMKALREGYELFEKNLRKNIARDVATLERLQDIARHIVGNPRGFDALTFTKAGSIVEHLPVAQRNDHVSHLSTAVDVGPVEELFTLVSKYRDAKDAKAKKKLDGTIAQECATLRSQYGEIMTTAVHMPEMPASFGKLWARMQNLLRNSKAVSISALTSVLEELMPPSVLARLVASESAAVEAGFDVDTIYLDVDSLRALIEAPKSQLAKFNQIFTSRIEAKKAAASARGESIVIPNGGNEGKALQRYRQKLAHIIQFTPEKLPTVLVPILSQALAHNVSGKFIWEVLRFAEDEDLKATHVYVRDTELGSDRDTLVSGTVRSSLHTPGARQFAADGGSTMGGTVLGSLERLAEVQEDAVTEQETAAVAAPRFEFTDALTDKDLQTLIRLFSHDYKNIGEDGQEIIDLFNHLGSGFRAVRTKEGKIKIFREASTVESADSGDDEVGGSGASAGGGSVSTHKKHTGRYKGLNPAFGAACVRDLLEPAGIDYDTARQLQIRRAAQVVSASSAGGASAASSSSSSSDDGKDPVLTNSGAGEPPHDRSGGTGGPSGKGKKARK